MYCLGLDRTDDCVDEESFLALSQNEGTGMLWKLIVVEGEVL
jgi:hypothetical protein